MPNNVAMVTERRTSRSAHVLVLEMVTKVEGLTPNFCCHCCQISLAELYGSTGRGLGRQYSRSFEHMLSC